MGGVMLEDGAEFRVVSGLDPETELRAAFSHLPQGRAVRRTWWRGGRRDDLQASREVQPGVHAFWVSAEGAVDDDLVQGALEEGELLIIELGEEQLGDPAGVDGRRLSEAGDACLGERHDDTAGVGTCSVSADEACINQPGDATGHARPRDERPVRQFRHAQLTVGLRQLREHVEVGQGQARLSFEICIESAYERGVGLQHRAPGRQPTAARYLLLDEPVEELGDIGLRKYLHVQLSRR